MKTHLIVGAAAMVLLFGLPTSGNAEALTFTLIAQTSPTGFSSFLAFPSINSGGTVVFRANLVGGGQGIFTGSGGQLTEIQTTINNPFSINSFAFGVPTINSAGTVAFHATFVVLV